MEKGKLVRDRIPDIIRASGEVPCIRILDEEQYLEELDRKLSEELAEYEADHSLEELADVMEVLLAVCKARGYSVEELETVRLAKRKARGGFENRIFWVGNEDR